MKQCFESIIAYRDLLLILVSRNIKVRYKRSVLGFFWTLLHPVFLIALYSVFLRLLKAYDASNPDYLALVVIGIFAWQFQSMCMGDSLHAVLGNANLVKKTSFPRIILPLSTVIANLANFLLTLPLLVIFVAVMGYVDGHYLMLPIVVVSHFALCLGVSLILSGLNVFFRDTEHLLSVVMLAWFFLSPIIYPFERIPEAYQRLAILNPLAGIITAYRTAFLGIDMIAPDLVAVSIGISWLILLLGIGLFNRWQHRFGDQL